MDTSFTDSYDKEFLQEHMMGPNAMRITEELAGFLPLAPGMRVLDLGCGKGLSSVLLAQKYRVTVFASDLWIHPDENARRFGDLGLDAQIFPFLVDATKDMPFAHDYFDMIVSVDSYQYFGGNDHMLPKLLPFVKSGGYIAIAVPGFNQEFPAGQMPDAIKPFWTPEWYFYTTAWWRRLWEKEPALEIAVLREMDSCDLAWDEWLQTQNPYALEDRKMMAAGAGKYFNIIQMIGRKICP